VLPNAWDVASARILEDAGFPAIATTSSGVAQTLGYPDGQRISREEMLESVGRIVRGVAVPVTADLEAGYGPAPEDVSETVTRAIEVGAIGANLEDSTGRAEAPLFDFSLAVERIRAARETAEAAGIPFVINGRTDPFLIPDAASSRALEESVRRADAYRQAGADCLFVPGVTDAGTIAKLVEQIDGPVNILAGPAAPSIRELESLGVARVSIGGGLARAVLAFVRRAARELLEEGTYTFTRDALTVAEVAKLFARSPS
jgi:2-methylisocitrate lyase-like PEP mutase family enzyme